MNERQRTVLVVGLLAVACHGFAALQFRTAGPALVVPPSFGLQLHLLLGASLALSAALLVAHLCAARLAAVVTLFACQVLVHILVGLPLGGYLGIESSLLTVLLFQAALLFGFPGSLTATITVSLITLAAQQPLSAWNEQIPAASSYDILALWLYAGALSLALNLLAHRAKVLRDKSRLAEQLDGAIAELTRANIGFQRFATSAEERSMRAERNRITREIHDTTGYVLTNLMMMMEAAGDLLEQEPERVRELLRAAHDQAQAALAETRKALRELREAEKPPEQGLVTIHKLVKAFEEATKTRVRVEYADVPWTLGEEADLAVYRLVQEGLTNAFKHGKATEIRLQFWRDEAGIGVNVRDNGFGCASVTEGLGFAGMRERIEQLGGSLKAGGIPNGFELSAWIPWSEGLRSG